VNATAPLDLRVRTWLRIASWLRAVGYYPTMKRMAEVPLAKRKASKPPWWMRGSPPRGVAIQEILEPAARVYRPAGSNGALPIVVFAHGGGFVNCGLDSMHHFCAHLASAAGVEVVSVDYPLAPESPFPAALECYYNALCSVAERGAEITVMGDSAGGNLAAAACLLARRRGGPEIRRQILIYPTLDATLSTPGLLAETAARRAECEAFYAHYVGDHSRSDELVSPLLAAELAELPPALVLTAGHDSFRDEGRLYAERLAAAGVAVRLARYLDMPHGFLSMPRLCRASARAMAEIVAALGSSNAPAVGQTVAAES
jgi:acetyl esterase